MSFSEIAHELGMKECTVQKHFETGMHKLRSRFPVLLRQLFDESRDRR